MRREGSEEHRGGKSDVVQRGLEVFGWFEWRLLIKETRSRFVRGNDAVFLGLSRILNFWRIRPQHLSIGLSIHSSIYPPFIGYILPIKALYI